MVDKLKLKILAHVSPHKISWLKKSQNYMVDERAWVDFEIGDYKDRILCEIIPLDAYHLLLAHLWEFDVKAQHECDENTYLIAKNGKKYKMDPLPKM